MKVKDFIKWLETQDTDLEILVISYTPSNYHRYSELDIDNEGHVEYIEGCLLLGGNGNE